MWVPCRISGYPGKTRFLVRPRVQEPGVGVVLTMVEQGYDPKPMNRAKARGVTPWML